MYRINRFAINSPLQWVFFPVVVGKTVTSTQQKRQELFAPALSSNKHPNLNRTSPS